MFPLMCSVRHTKDEKKIEILLIFAVETVTSSQCSYVHFSNVQYTLSFPNHTNNNNKLLIQ